jgi:hypothetical protein
MEKVLVDSCIFIDIFRGYRQLYQDLLKQKVFLNSIVYMELIQGSRDKIELKRIVKFLKDFKVLPINQKISKKSMELMYVFYQSWITYTGCTDSCDCDYKKSSLVDIQSKRLSIHRSFDSI